MTAHIKLTTKDVSEIINITTSIGNDARQFEQGNEVDYGKLCEIEQSALRVAEIVKAWMDSPEMIEAIEAELMDESNKAEIKAWMKIQDQENAIDENDHNEYDENESKQILITDEQKQKMLDNNAMRQGHADNVYSPYPVVKLFNPNGGGTWLLTEIAMNNQDLAFGLCDLGMGFPELGWVSIAELKEIRTPFGLGIERDAWFEASKTLTDYTIEATRNFRIMA